jgi:hypothetical protein
MGSAFRVDELESGYPVLAGWVFHLSQKIFGEIFSSFFDWLSDFCSDYYDGLAWISVLK